MREVIRRMLHRSFISALFSRALHGETRGPARPKYVRRIPPYSRGEFPRKLAKGSTAAHLVLTLYFGAPRRNGQKHATCCASARAHQCCSINLRVPSEEISIQRKIKTLLLSFPPLLSSIFQSLSLTNKTRPKLSDSIESRQIFLANFLSHEISATSGSLGDGRMNVARRDGFEWRTATYL